MKIYINRKFTRHDNPAIGSPNPDADAVLVGMLADANDNGATTEGVEVEGIKLVQITGVGQDELSLDLSRYIARKGIGCDVLDSDACKAFVEILDLADNPSPLLPGYSHKVDEEGNETPWTWGEWLARPDKDATSRDGRSFIGAATFDDRSISLKASENTELFDGGIVLLHPNDLPAEEV